MGADELLVTEARTPSDWVRPDWNWISLPIDPMSPLAGDVFGDRYAVNKLFRWNPIKKTIELYPDDFRQIEVGVGYMLLAEDIQNHAYAGAARRQLTAIRIPRAGWHWFGHAFANAVELEKCCLRDLSTGVTRTAADDASSGSPWLDWNMRYWDPFSQSVRTLAISGGDDTMLRPWYGYRVWSNREDLALLIPPE
jgi:hypothetical protein